MRPTLSHHAEFCHHPCEGRKAALKEAFTALMTADAGKVAAAIDALAARLSKEAAARKLTAKEQLVLRLNEQYPKARWD